MFIYIITRLSVITIIISVLITGGFVVFGNINKTYVLAFVGEDRSNFAVTNASRSSDIYLADLNHRFIINLTNTPNTWEETPSWSPDGKAIVYAGVETGVTNLFTISANGRKRTQLTDTSYRDAQPAWSPDGQYIAFSSNRDGNADIYLLTFDSFEIQNLTQHTNADDAPSWTPEQRLLFRSNREGNWDIFLTDADLENPTTYIEHPGWEGMAHWVDNQLLFESRRDGNINIYQQDVATKVTRPILDSEGNHTYPALSPDGEWLSYHMLIDSNFHLQVHHLETSEEFSLVDDRERDIQFHSAQWMP